MVGSTADDVRAMDAASIPCSCVVDFISDMVICSPVACAWLVLVGVSFVFYEE